MSCVCLLKSLFKSWPSPAPIKNNETVSLGYSEDPRKVSEQETETNSLQPRELSVISQMGKNTLMAKTSGI